MALLQRNIASGIDIPIQRFQSFMYQQIITKILNVSEVDLRYKCYGRCYRNNSKEGYIPELFQGGKEYKPLFYDDSMWIVSFFGIGENTSVSDTGALNSVHLIFWMNLSKFDGLVGAGDRFDENIRVKLYDLFSTQRFGFNLTGVELGWENVYREYPGFLKNNDKYRDMHPYHAFRFNFNLNYNPLSDNITKSNF
jgi:hypothetical protein